MRGVRRQFVFGGLLAVLVGLGVVLSPERALAALRWSLASPWFPAILVGLYLLRPLLAWPITALSALVGVRYGLPVGVPIALTGAVATSLLPYGVARAYRPDAGIIGRASRYSESYFEATGDLRGIVGARLAPAPAEPISLAAGAARVPIPAFVLGTALGELPWTIAAVAAGASMGRLVLADASPAPWLLVAGVLGAGLLLLGPVVRSIRARSAEGV